MKKQDKKYDVLILVSVSVLAVGNLLARYINEYFYVLSIVGGFTVIWVLYKKYLER